jgi:predicted nucleic acid-binding protein
MLTDTGPIVALLDQSERSHASCARVLARLEQPLVTTWPVLTEAMYLISRVFGWPGQAALWRLVERGTLQLAGLSDEGVARMRVLMEQYRNVPMDFADASLVVVAEERGLDRIFTLDSDFRIYRLARGRTFTVIP